MGIGFEFMDKSKSHEILPTLFSILHSNMDVIAPTGNTYAEDERIFLENVAPALEKAPRRIVLIYSDESLAGYFQYYVNGELFMMEEIQLIPQHQGTGAFRELYRWLLPQIPDSVRRVEAYSHKKNVKSQQILRHLGLSPIEENKNNYHFRGELSLLRAHYCEKA